MRTTGLMSPKSCSGQCVLAEGSGRADHAEERGDPLTERLPERGPAGEGGSKAGPDTAGHPEAQGADSQGEGAQQEGEEKNYLGTSAVTPQDNDHPSVIRSRLCRRNCSLRRQRSMT